MSGGNNQSLMEAGSRPGSRATVVSAKVAKTMDAPSGFMGGEGRQSFEERTNSLCSNTVRDMRRASLPGASRQASIELKGAEYVGPWPMFYRPLLSVD